MKSYSYVWEETSRALRTRLVITGVDMLYKTTIARRQNSILLAHNLGQINWKALWGIALMFFPSLQTWVLVLNLTALSVWKTITQEEIINLATTIKISYLKQHSLKRYNKYEDNVNFVLFLNKNHAIDNGKVFLNHKTKFTECKMAIYAYWACSMPSLVSMPSLAAGKRSSRCSVDKRKARYRCNGMFCVCITVCVLCHIFRLLCSLHI